MKRKKNTHKKKSVAPMLPKGDTVLTNRSLWTRSLREAFRRNVRNERSKEISKWPQDPRDARRSLIKSMTRGTQLAYNHALWQKAYNASKGR